MVPAEKYRPCLLSCARTPRPERLSQRKAMSPTRTPRTQIRRAGSGSIALFAGLLLAFGLPRFAALAAAGAAPANTIAAHFTETRTIEGIEQPIVLRGVVRFTPGTHLSWTVTSPYRYRLEIEAGQIKQIMPDGTVKKQPLSEVPWAASLFKLFSGMFGGNHEALKRYFEIARKANKLLLTPRSKVLAKWVARITVVGRPLPRRVTIEQSGGGRTRLTFTPVDQVRSAAPGAATQ